MSNLTELEIIDCLRDNLRKAEQHCRDLAFLPAQGPTYTALREENGLIEGASRQLAAFRGDARWALFAVEIMSFQQRLGDCIRSHHARKIFLRFAEMMAFFLKKSEELRTAKTGKRGSIVPKPRARGKHRETRPVYVRRDSGLYVPSP